MFLFPVNHRLTHAMAYKLKELTRHPKHYCFRCDKRNDIENVYFCLNCGEVRCWECINQHEKKFNLFDGKKHHLCSCGHYLKLWDEWYRQAEKLYPDVFQNK